MGTQIVSESVLNFRKMRHDFSPAALKEGKLLFEKGGCLGARVASCTATQVVVIARVMGHFQDPHECSIEIDRTQSVIAYSNCDCSLGVDCQHLACLLFFLEEHFHSLLLVFLGKGTAREHDLSDVEMKVKAKARKEHERQLISDYSHAGEWLGRSSLFRSAVERAETGELLLILGAWNGMNNRLTEVQMAVKVTGRPKPVLIQQPRTFLLALQQLEPLMLGSQRVVLSDVSFGQKSAVIVDFLRREFEYHEKADKITRASFLTQSALFGLLSLVANRCVGIEGERISLFLGSLEKPIIFSKTPVSPSFAIEHLVDPDPRLVIKPFFTLPNGSFSWQEVKVVLASNPGVLSDDHYYPLTPTFSLRQAVDLEELDHHVIPEPLFPTFMAYGLPNLRRFGEVTLPEGLKNDRRAPTLVDPIAVCHVDIADGELSVELAFKYGQVEVPEVRREHSLTEIRSLNQGQAIIPRNLMKELFLSQELVWGLAPDEKEGRYTTKSEKRIIEFVSETLPALGENVEWHLSDGLKRCFCFKQSSVTIKISESGQPGHVLCRLKSEGPLSGLDVGRIMEAARFRRSYIETGRGESGIFPKKLVLMPQEEVEAISLVIEDFSIPSFKEGEWLLPLWSVIGIEEGQTLSSQITIQCTPGVRQFQKSLTDLDYDDSVPIAARLNKFLHPYQKAGVRWLRRLRDFGLGGILADDMGLGKTVQAICALSEVHTNGKKVPPSLIVCPTSLVDNWKEELARFDPHLKVVTFVGAPGERRKLLAHSKNIDVFVTSYGLIQRDLEQFEGLSFSYILLDEAQAIKNRETRNARSVKRLKADYRLVLTGTPIENSLEDLWSLFDYLMPGFLSSHERFMQTYVRPGRESEKSIDFLKKRIAPFVLRRMKHDVLEDLPPISHITYHCYLHNEQQAIYQKAAKQAKEELVTLVEREGFDKARLHVLATLTRLKQICCHPNLVLKDGEQKTSSAKYEMLQDLLDGLIENGHKTVLFSQYTRMLGIIREDLVRNGIPHLYLDGTTKNRLSLVKQFNDDPNIPIFLVSLRAGGNGLNLVGADSVIHYDMWWNPAVENQATDRVWRMGQKTKVTSYRLITKGTIEEYIVGLQEKKRDLISGLVESDEDMLSKLSWEDVLGLLKT